MEAALTDIDGQLAYTSKLFYLYSIKNGWLGFTRIMNRTDGTGCIHLARVSRTRSAISCLVLYFKCGVCCGVR